MNEILGLISVLVTTNFVAVDFSANLCPHPGCGDAHNYTATERYMIIRDTWAEVVGTRTNRRLHSETNEWGSLTHQIAHPAVYKMHTEPGHPVRPGTRWPNDMPPLPPWEAYKRAKAPKRSNAAALPSDIPKAVLRHANSSQSGFELLKFPEWIEVRDTLPSDNGSDLKGGKLRIEGGPRELSSYASATNGLYGELFGMSLKAAAKLTNANGTIYTNQYGVLYDVTTNYPSEKLVLEKRGVDRLSGVRVWSGEAVVRYTNPHPTMIVWTNGGGWHASEGRFRAVPATTELPGARRFVP